MAAKEEGIDEVPCVFADYLTEAQKKAYILADNRMALDAGWDESLLAVEIEELKNLGFDTELIVKNSSSPQPEEENTLREKLLKKDSLKKVRGVVTATEYTSLNASAAAGQGKIAIDGVEYDTNLNISDYLG